MSKGITSALGPRTSSLQDLAQGSYDPEFSVNAVEITAYDTAGNLTRVLVSPQGYLLTSAVATIALSADAVGNRVSAFSNDAGLLRVSSIGGSSVSLSADASGNRVSAVQVDATNLNVSAKSGDASTFRVSAIGGTAGDHTLVDGTDQTVSAKIAQISASISSNANTLITKAMTWSAAELLVSAKAVDANQLHVSAFVDSGSVSAKQGTYPWSVSGNVSAFINQGTISAIQPDANILHTSAVQGDAGLQHVSAFVDSGSVSAKSSVADNFRVSAFSNDAGLLRVSSVGADGSNDRTSVLQVDAGLLHTSAFIDSGSVSAKQGDAGNLHVSAELFADTVGALTVFQTLSISASQSVKGSAGALYGYYFYNSDTKFNFIKLYNVSAAANIGTDTPIMTIGIPPSAAANVEYPHGLAGFTNGINVTATSGRALDNTAAPAASAVGGVLFYK